MCDFMSFDCLRHCGACVAGTSAGCCPAYWRERKHGFNNFMQELKAGPLPCAVAKPPEGRSAHLQVGARGLRYVRPPRSSAPADEGAPHATTNGACPPEVGLLPALH